METITISKHKLSCLIEAATIECLFCPMREMCKDEDNLSCNEVIQKWLKEDS